MYNGILFGHQENEIVFFAEKKMELKVIVLSENISFRKTNIVCFP